MKQYEAYKNSGIQWLGEIPSHWKTTQMKRLFSFGKGLSITKSDLVEEGQPVISYGQVHAKNNPGTRVEDHLLRFVPVAIAESNPSSAVSKGDFIFADTSEDLTGCGNCAYIDRDGIFAGYHSVIARSERRDNKYFAYLFLTDAWRTQLRSSVGGVKVFSITQSILGQTTIIIPSEKEQEVIAAYLDQKVGKIDAILSEKEAMVEQLQQYRKSLISETVTRGLDPNVPMKDSGIDWIGQIPQHWSMVKLKYISSLQSGSNLTSEQIKDTGEYPVFGGNGLRGYYHDFNTEGDRVLIGRQGALCGNINYASGKFWATEHAVVCHPIKQYNVIWLGSLLEIMNLNQYSIASAQPGLSVDRIKQLEIPLPPFEEQEKIGSLIEKKDSELKQTISELQSQIEDLKAYKSSVITEAVTGKVDLRDWKPSEVTA